MSCFTNAANKMAEGDHGGTTQGWRCYDIHNGHYEPKNVYWWKGSLNGKDNRNP